MADDDGAVNGVEWSEWVSGVVDVFGKDGTSIDVSAAVPSVSWKNILTKINIDLTGLKSSSYNKGINHTPYTRPYHRTWYAAGQAAKNTSSNHS